MMRAHMRGGSIAHVAPSRDNGRNPVAATAGYAHALARAMQDQGATVEIWGHRQPGTMPGIREDAGVQTVSAWRPGAWAGLDLWRCLRARRPAVLHVHLEYFSYGGPSGFASLVLFLLAAHLIGARVVVTMHQVVGLRGLTTRMLDEFDVPLGLGAARRLLRLSTALIARVTDRVIVHDLVFQRCLVEEYGVRPSRVEVVPHGVPDASPNGADGTPMRVGTSMRVILLFGYIKWYKGIDIVLRAWRSIAPAFPDWKVVIAGGLPGGLRHNHPHIRFLASLRRLAAPIDRQVEFMGYVDDATMDRLFRQAAVVLLPYRVLFAASGPLAAAAGYRRPVVISEALRRLLPAWPLWSRNKTAAWRRMLQRVLIDERARSEAVDHLSVLAATRAWPDIARQTMAVYRQVVSLQAVPRTSS